MVRGGSGVYGIRPYRRHLPVYHVTHSRPPLASCQPLARRSCVYVCGGAGRGSDSRYNTVNHQIFTLRYFRVSAPQCVSQRKEISIIFSIPPNIHLLHFKSPASYFHTNLLLHKKYFHANLIISRKYVWRVNFCISHVERRPAPLPPRPPGV